MTSQKDQIQTLITEIDDVLQKANPRLPWVGSGETTQQRQVLERVRNYLVSFYQRLASEEEGSASITEEALLGQDFYYHPPQTLTPVSFFQGDNLSGQNTQQVMQALLQEIRYLRASLAQPSLDPQQLTTELVQVLMSRLQESLSRQITQALEHLRSQPLSCGTPPNYRDPYGGSAEGGNSILAALASTSPQYEQLQALRSRSDQMLINLDSTLNIIFESLQRNIQSYQESLSQGVERMYTLGQQSEVAFKGLVELLTQQLQQDASSYLGSLPQTGRALGEPSAQERSPIEQRPFDADYLSSGDLGAGNLRLGDSLDQAIDSWLRSARDFNFEAGDFEAESADSLDLGLAPLDLSHLELEAFEAVAIANQPQDLGLAEPNLVSGNTINSIDFAHPTEPVNPTETANIDATLKFLEELSAELEDSTAPNSLSDPEIQLNQILAAVQGAPEETSPALVTQPLPSPDTTHDEMDEFYQSLFGEIELLGEPGAATLITEPKAESTEPKAESEIPAPVQQPFASKQAADQQAVDQQVFSEQQLVTDIPTPELPVAETTIDSIASAFDLIAQANSIPESEFASPVEFTSTAFVSTEISEPELPESLFENFSEPISAPPPVELSESLFEDFSEPISAPPPVELPESLFEDFSEPISAAPPVELSESLFEDFSEPISAAPPVELPESLFEETFEPAIFQPVTFEASAEPEVVIPPPPSVESIEMSLQPREMGSLTELFQAVSPEATHAVPIQPPGFKASADLAGGRSPEAGTEMESEDEYTRAAPDENLLPNAPASKIDLNLATLDEMTLNSLSEELSGFEALSNQTGQFAGEFAQQPWETFTSDIMPSPSFTLDDFATDVSQSREFSESASSPLPQPEAEYPVIEYPSVQYPAEYSATEDPSVEPAIEYSSVQYSATEQHLSTEQAPLGEQPVVQPIVDLPPLPQEFGYRFRDRTVPSLEDFVAELPEEILDLPTVSQASPPGSFSPPPGSNPGLVNLEQVTEGFRELFGETSRVPELAIPAIELGGESPFTLEGMDDLFGELPSAPTAPYPALPDPIQSISPQQPLPFTLEGMDDLFSDAPVGDRPTFPNTPENSGREAPPKGIPVFKPQPFPQDYVVGTSPQFKLERLDNLFVDLSSSEDTVSGEPPQAIRQESIADQATPSAPQEGLRSPIDSPPTASDPVKQDMGLDQAFESVTGMPSPKPPVRKLTQGRKQTQQKKKRSR